MFYLLVFPVLLEKPIVRSRYSYQVGGNLPWDSPVYICRQADIDLYEAIRQHRFATVLGPRQMGRSSLRVHTRHRLESAGYCCSTVYGTQLLDSPQDYYRWDKQLSALVWDSLRPNESARLAQWLQDTEGLLPQQRLERFTRELIQPILTEAPVVVFIDVAESLLDVPFLANDVFEWIWYCRCLRKIYPIYERLNFVVLGNVISTDLIKSEALLHSGRAITLTNFKIEDTAPLQQGFASHMVEPAQLMKAIFQWTDGQPLLTQKLCGLVSTLLNEFETPAQPTASLSASLEQWVSHLVTTSVIETWNRQDNLSYLWDICYLLTRSQYKKPLMAMYRRILADQPVKLNGDRLQAELMLSGLAIACDGHLCSGNDIYRHIFGALT